jgi:hypothetical protein
LDGSSGKLLYPAPLPLLAIPLTPREVLIHVDEPPPPHLETEERKMLHQQIHEIVGRINGQLGTLDWTPIVFSNQPLSPLVGSVFSQSRRARFSDFFSFFPQETAALFSIADGAVISPLREGMNLTAYGLPALALNYFRKSPQFGKSI